MSTRPIQILWAEDNPADADEIRSLRSNRRIVKVQHSRSLRQDVDPFFGETEFIRQLKVTALKITDAMAPILICGETGTGKSTLAKWLHHNGPRAREAFVDLNCAGLAPQLIETELFGHEQGAFTGAVKTKQGLLEVAHGGSLFLDEIADMDLRVQPKLLKIIEGQGFYRVGGTHERQTDIRLIAATHRDLRVQIVKGRFREDLYYRLNTITLVIPPLRERVDDIPLLAERILERLANGSGETTILDPEAADALRTYHWPGNIRELRNILERAVLLGEGSTIRRDDLCFETPLPMAGPASDPNLSLEEVERRHIEAVLRHHNGRVEAAAKNLGVPRSSLYHKLKRYRDMPA